MLSVYTNQQELLKSTSATTVSRLESVDKSLLETANYAVTFKDGFTPELEMHVYTPDGVYLTGNHRTLFNIESNDTTSNLLAYQTLCINVATELENLGIVRGQYKLIYNVFDNIVGAYDEQKLWIKEISPSRREIRLQLADISNFTLLQQVNNFIARWQELSSNNIFDSFVLNFGFNETYQIINVRFAVENNIPEIIIKLYKPLPSKYGEKSKVWISEEIIDSIVDSTIVVPKHIPEPVNTLRPANFEIEDFEGMSVATSFKTWNDLLTENISTSQQLIDSYFSGSLSGIKLNINYRNFENFVHYSSAVERVKNFKYKLQLIEYYSDRIDQVAAVNGGDITNVNLINLFVNRNRVVSGFDEFERYLFFESTGSRLYTHYDSGTGSIDPWPKKTPTALTWSEAWTAWSTATSLWSIGASPDPYGYFSNQVLTTSTEGQIYYADLLEKAEIYDRFNIHKLTNTVPIFIQDSDDNSDYILFVNMLGQHFDILWTYIANLTTIKYREEHPKDGVPDDLLYHIASSMGFDLLNGRSTSELWRYSLGIDENGVALKSDVDNVTTLPDEKTTKEIWRRIVNNLPYILKSKGTSRSIKALLSCFGIPSTVLTIKEYGGPSTFTDNNHYPEYIHDVYHYAWLSEDYKYAAIDPNTYDNGFGVYVIPDTLEFRFKSDSNYTYDVGTPYTVFSSANSTFEIIKETADDNQATITYTVAGSSGSISNLEIFDNSWHTVSVTNTTSSVQFNVVKSLYGKTIYNRSASFVTTIPSASFTELVGFGGSFLGHFHDIRLWSGSLNDATLEEHAASPGTYTYNVDRSALTTGEEAAQPYYRLLQRYQLTNSASYGVPYPMQMSIHPNQKINQGQINFVGYSSNTDVKFEGFEETYYTPSPSLGNTSLYTNKVRIESSSLDPNKRLNTKTRIERSSFDRYSIDSNRVGVYFSPQTAINEDIFNQLGYFEIDDYIGDPAYTYGDTYTALNNFAIQYWKKYENRNDFEAYFRALGIYDFTLFKYIKRLIPQRSNPVVGLLVEPNVLERSKVRLLNKPTIEDLTKSAHITKEDLVTLTDSEFDANKLGIVDASEIYRIEADANQIDRGIIVGAIDTDRLGTNWVEHKYIGRYKLTVSGSYKPLQTAVLNSRVSDHLKTVVYFYTSSQDAFHKLPYSSSLILAEINDNQYSTGHVNSRYAGSKLSGAGINIDSEETVDGGPVVKITPVNPNQIVFANGQVTTINQSVTGGKNKSI